jgi:hypothetical protein
MPATAQTPEILPDEAELNEASVLLGNAFDTLEMILFRMNKAYEAYQDDSVLPKPPPDLEMMGSLYSFREGLRLDARQILDLVDKFGAAMFDLDCMRLALDSRAKKKADDDA